jgi:hypothetical protein
VRAGTEYPAGDINHELPGETDPDKIAQLFKMINNLSMALNQHAVIINKTQQNEKKYLEEQEACGMFDKIAEAISLYDNEFIEKLEIPGMERQFTETQASMRRTRTIP